MQFARTCNRKTKKSCPAEAGQLVCCSILASVVSLLSPAFALLILFFLILESFIQQEGVFIASHLQFYLVPATVKKGCQNAEANDFD